MSDRVGQQLGSYRLLQLLGQGGFAEVYLGEHIHLNTQAAIKALRTQLSTDDVSNFRIEARTIAHLIHPNIVQVLDFGVEGDTPFLVMAYAPNGTLRQRHPRGIPLPVESILLYVKQIAAALQYAHDKKVIHRDIKPENMLLGRNNEVLLSDFGIALITPSARAGTIFGQSSIPNQTTWDPAGTVTYMAPEQIQGKPSPASDQYSLGIVVYEWLSGHAPFSGGYMEIAMQHMSASPTPLREKLTAISPDVEQVIMTALAKDPQRRFGSVQAFANALEQASRGPQRVISSTLSASSPENAPVSSHAAEEPSMEVILFGPSGRTILGSSVVTIGRNASNTVVVNDPQASAFHAEIRPSGQGHRIIDLNSTNGTFVNEQRLAPGSSRQLNWGDTLRVGETKLNYGGGSATQNRVSTSDPATVRADSGYSGYVPSGPVPAPPPPISNTGYGGIAQQAYPQQPAPFPSVYPPPLQQQAYGVLAPQQQAYPQSGPGISGSSPNNVTPVQFNVSSTLPDNVAQQPAYNAQAGLPATPISSPATTGAMPSQAASSSSKRRRPALLIALLGILVFVLVGGGVLAFVLYQNSLPTPAKTLDAFCNALQGS
jgi:serine/threonine protein kinase